MTSLISNPNALNQINVAVIGLGYVGLPLAIQFAKHFKTIGFDINKSRINELKNSVDKTLEVDSEELKETNLQFSYNVSEIKQSNVFIVTVPTPIDKNKKPNLSALISASQMVSKCLKKGDFVIYESTVYPGATEEVCIPELEKSGLIFNQDFFVGYSPERINPGDKEHKFVDIPKVVSASNLSYGNFIKKLYQHVIKAEIYLAKSIKVAEAAKIMENTQRDINIALVNEFAQIFDNLNIDIEEVIDAAKTKWNFHPYKPGLVGGHCIGVDPYYIIHKAQSIGYQPKLILAGRELNTNMVQYVAEKFIRKISCLDNKTTKIRKILICGLTFKANCPDIRNSKVFELIEYLKKNDFEIDVFDPWINEVDTCKLEEKYGFSLKSNLSERSYDGILIAVAHNCFIDKGVNFFKKTLKKGSDIIYDFKKILT